MTLFLSLPVFWRVKEGNAFIQGWSHIALKHPLSFLQHQLFCHGRLTWLQLGARQISACESLNSRNSPKGMWGRRRRRGGEHIKPRICYCHSLKAAHTKAGVTGGRSEGKGEGLLLSTGTWVTSALLYSQSDNGCGIDWAENSARCIFLRDFFLECEKLALTILCQVCF